MPKRINVVRDRVLRGQHEDRDRYVLPAHSRGEIETVSVRKRQVQNDDVGVPAVDQLGRAGDVTSMTNSKPTLVQAFLDGLGDAGIVLD